jgi:quercetin dioxygenase-like cupin family protein
VDTLRVDVQAATPHPHPEWFSGPVRVQDLRGGTVPQDLEIFAVFFDAGARTLPHVHSTEQLLYFLNGEGIVAVEGSRRRYGSGGMAIIPAGTWHWHGATPSSPMMHLSIRPGGPSTWAPDVPMGDWDSYMAGVSDG